MLTELILQSSSELTTSFKPPHYRIIYRCIIQNRPLLLCFFLTFGCKYVLKILWNPMLFFCQCRCDNSWCIMVTPPCNMVPNFCLLNFNCNPIIQLDSNSDPSLHPHNFNGFLFQNLIPPHPPPYLRSLTVVSVQRCYQMSSTQHYIPLRIAALFDKTIPRMPGKLLVPQSEWWGWKLLPQAIYR